MPKTRLQNISTGQIEPDPVRPGAQFRVDLNSTTGTSPLCPPLRLPALVDGQNGQRERGDVTMLGRFALSTGLASDTALLERCHSHWRLTLRGQAIGSSRMVLWSDSWLDPTSSSHGLSLPSVRRFSFDIPRRFHPGLAELKGIAVSARTIFVVGPGGGLWAANVPRIR